MQEECKKCHRQLLAKEMRKAFENAMGPRIIQALCIFCGREIETPALKVVVGKKMRNVPESYKEVDTAFLSAQSMLKLVEFLLFEGEDVRINIAELMQFNKQIFWNLIYYFSEYRLPADFMLCYEDT